VRIAVAGAGIAGLTAASALAQRGFSVEVFEQAANLAEIGAGIQLSPNAMAALAELGVSAGLRGTVSPQAIDIRDAVSGRRLARIPLGQTARNRYGAPYCLVHRADLQAALLAAVGRDHRISIRLGVGVEGASDTAQGVSIEAAGRRLSADILVAADGVHSRLRQAVFGHPGAQPLPRHAWRATLPAADVPPAIPLDSTVLWLGPGAHLVHYPLRGGAELNVVAIAGGPALPAPPVAGFAAPAGDLIAAIAGWTSWPLAEVDAALPWTRGRTVLIGDAAHGMPPSAAQGGAQAIEDAWVLARSLAAQPSNPSAALSAYERERRPRVERVVREARRNLTLYNMGGVGRLARNLAIAGLPPRAHLARLNWLYGWKPR
jgi:salicylate hydroxylase